MRIISTDPREPGIIGVGQEACGIFAFGQTAHGVVAVGQLARGFFVVGQLAIGVFAIGQGAIGLWHATGMVGLAGQRGYGLILHTLPRLVTDPRPELPSVVPLAEIARGATAEAWVAVRITTREGAPAIDPDDGDALIDVSAIYPRLVAALQAGQDAACVKVRASVVHGPSVGYRDPGAARLELVADDVVPFVRRPPTHLAFSVPPKGAPGKGRASAGGIAARAAIWVGMLVFWWLIVGWPLLAAFAGWGDPF